MFHFPAYTPTQAMHSPAGNTTQLMLGFPIRTSSDQRLVGNSPRLNAASHVLHRPSMPRHPPYARNTKQHTLLLHTYERLQTVDTQQTTQITQKTRCSRPLYSSHTTHTPHQQPPQQAAEDHGMPQQQEHTMLPQTPNSMPTHTKTISCHRATLGVTPHEHTRQATSRHPDGIHQHDPGCMSTRNFQTNNAAVAHSATSTTQHPQLRAQNISSLERR